MPPVRRKRPLGAHSGDRNESDDSEHIKTDYESADDSRKIPRPKRAKTRNSTATQTIRSIETDITTPDRTNTVDLNTKITTLSAARQARVEEFINKQHEEAQLERPMLVGKIQDLQTHIERRQKYLTNKLAEKTMSDKSVRDLKKQPDHITGKSDKVITTIRKLQTAIDELMAEPAFNALVALKHDLCELKSVLAPIETGVIETRNHSLFLTQVNLKTEGNYQELVNKHIEKAKKDISTATEKRKKLGEELKQIE